MVRKKYNDLEKLNIIVEVSNGEIGFLAATKKYEINKTTLMNWQRRYKLYGYEGLGRRTQQMFMFHSNINKNHNHSALPVIIGWCFFTFYCPSAQSGCRSMPAAAF